jgi:hypothetical protein
LFEQGIALFEDPVVVGAHASPAGLSGDEQVVEEGPAPGRVTFDEGEILGGEQHGAQGAEHVAGAGEGGLVESRSIGPAGGELKFDERLPVMPDHGRANHGLCCAEAHERLVGGDAVAAECRDIAQRLDEVGFALAVEAHDRRDARRERELRDGIRAEVDEREVPDVHGVCRHLPRSSVHAAAPGLARRRCARSLSWQ